jgi:hypothetical protein
MASTTFIDNQTTIYAAWLNDVNNAVYNGIFAASSISPTNLICNGTVSGSGFTGLVNNTLSAPGPIGSVTPNTGAFTTLTASSPIAVSSGGTGLATLTANNVLLGNGTSAVQRIAPSTAGNVLTSNGTTWASTAPVRGVGGTGTSWRDVTASRASATTYTNSNSYPIAVSASGSAANGGPAISILVDGVQVSYFNWQYNGAGARSGGFVIVPAGSTYSLTFNGSGIAFWAELY